MVGKTGMLLGTALLVGACSDDAPSDVADAAADAPIDAGRCGADVFFGGELVDFDSTRETFMGVAGAVLTLEGDSSKTHTTAPNGRIELCIPAGTRSRVTVDAPAPYLDGTYIADPAVLAGDRFVSVKGVTLDRFKAAIATVAYKADAAQLLVEVQGKPGALSIDAAKDSVLVFDGTAWKVPVQDAVGSYVLFVNVEPGAHTLAMAGSIGAGAVELTKGSWVMTTVVGK